MCLPHQIHQLHLIHCAMPLRPLRPKSIAYCDVGTLVIPPQRCDLDTQRESKNQSIICQHICDRSLYAKRALLYENPSEASYSKEGLLKKEKLMSNLSKSHEMQVKSFSSKCNVTLNGRHSKGNAGKS